MTARCLCTHLASYHQPDRGLCLGSSVCGCAEFRPAKSTPVRFRDDWSDVVEPRRRSDFGAHQPGEYPERYEVTD